MLLAEGQINAVPPPDWLLSVRVINILGGVFVCHLAFRSIAAWFQL